MELNVIAELFYFDKFTVEAAATHTVDLNPQGEHAVSKHKDYSSDNGLL